MAKKIVRSPRAPSFHLEECVGNALRIYAANSKHSIPADVAAKTLGYSGANNGSAARVLASMKAFGVLDSNNKGDVSVSGEVEEYRYAPDEKMKQEILIKWLRSPKIYSELLDEYHGRLPSDELLRYKLIQKGFLPPAAEECLKNFRASVEFARYFEYVSGLENSPEDSGEILGGENEPQNHAQSTHPAPLKTSTLRQPPQAVSPQVPSISDGLLTDRIPVRLSKGRRAWIEVPTPLYSSDKEILKRQIDLLFTDDEEEEAIA